METLHEERVGTMTVKLVADEHCENDPREWDNLGVMVCWHSRYLLGDREEKEVWGTPDRFLEWVAAAKPIYLPLYLYDHSGISMSTGREYPFDCQWDSGQVGWIYVSRAKIHKEYKCRRITPKLTNKVINVLKSEVEAYDAHIRGMCFGYVVEDEDGNHIDSCWGFHGYRSIDWDYALNQAKEAATAAIENNQVASGI